MSISVKLILKEIDKIHTIRPVLYTGNFSEKYKCSRVEYTRNRRFYRNQLIASIIEDDNFVVDEQRHSIKYKQHEKYFSASYSDNDILVAIQDKPVGVDLERYKKLTEEKGELFINDKERIIMNNELIGQEEINKITMMWCLKESVGKLFGVGISKGFNLFDFVGIVDNVQYEVYAYYLFMKDCCAAICSWNCLEG